MLVKKAKWIMCVDFTNMNKFWPKDSFSIPYINLIVDSTTGHRMLSFMDAYSGYNKICKNPDDKEKKSFITEMGLLTRCW